MNLERAAKEINSARQLRSYVDTLLKQVIEDLRDQWHTVNNAFRDRIELVKEAKTKLETQHFEVDIIHNPKLLYLYRFHRSNL